MSVPVRWPSNKKTLAIAYAVVFAAHLAIGLAFGYFYRYITIRGFEAVNEKILDVTGTHFADLPRGYPYILKLWGDDAPQDVFVNNKEIIHFFFRQRKNIKEFYYFIPAALINDARTRIRIEPPIRFSLRLRNSVASSEWGSITLPSSKTRPSTSWVPLAAFAGGALGLVFFWTALGRIWPKVKATDIAATYFWSCLFILFNFWLLKMVSRPFKILFIFHPSSWVLCVLLTLGLFQVLRVFSGHLAHLKRERPHKACDPSFLPGVLGVYAVLNHVTLLAEGLNKTRSKNFVLAAIISLALISLTLAFGLLLLANLLAIIVYGCLVLATIRRFDEVRVP